MKSNSDIIEKLKAQAFQKNKDDPLSEQKTPKIATVSSRNIQDSNKQMIQKTKPKGFESKTPKPETSFTQIYKNFVKPHRSTKSPAPAPKNHDTERLIDQYFPGHARQEEPEKSARNIIGKTSKAKKEGSNGTQTDYSFQRFCDKKDKFLYLLDNSKSNLVYDDTDVFEFLMLMNGYYEQKILNVTR